MDRHETLSIIAAEAGRGELTFPTSAKMALRIQQAIDDPDCRVETAAHLIRAEPLVSARVVALANSMAFNRSGREVTDVRVAVTLLGFHTVRALVTAVITRQMAGVSADRAHRALVAQLWEHTAHMAALAYVIARRVTRQDPETAMFAGIVHEVGGFYLLSRAKDFPGLMDGMDESEGEGEDAAEGEGEGAIEGEGEGVVGRAVLKVLSVPEPVVAAIEALWQGYLAMPPTTLGDTLLLADQLAPVKSPLRQLLQKNHDGKAAAIDMILEQETLVGILTESAKEVESLTEALRF